MKLESEINSEFSMSSKVQATGAWNVPTAHVLGNNSVKELNTQDQLRFQSENEVEHQNLPDQGEDGAPPKKRRRRRRHRRRRRRRKKIYVFVPVPSMPFPIGTPLPVLPFTQNGIPPMQPLHPMPSLPNLPNLTFQSLEDIQKEASDIREAHFRGTQVRQQEEVTVFSKQHYQQNSSPHYGQPQLVVRDTSGQTDLSLNSGFDSGESQHSDLDDEEEQDDGPQFVTPDVLVKALKQQH